MAGPDWTYPVTILAIAGSTDEVDTAALADALDNGRARSMVMRPYDGTNVANPGVSVRWVNGGFGTGFPVIDADEPAVYERLLTRAAELAKR